MKSKTEMAISVLAQPAKPIFRTYIYISFLRF